MTPCWFAQNVPNAGPCDGSLIKAHLIPRQLMRRELTPEQYKEAQWDPRGWVWGCGGVTGLGGHHGRLDVARTLRIPFDRLSPDLLAFARDYGLEWWLLREYNAGRAVA